MAINYEIRIVSLKKEAQGDLSDVVYQVNYQYVGTNEEDIEGIVPGAVQLTPNPESFTEYSQITEEEVKGWVEKCIGESTPLDEMGGSQVGALKQSMQKNIERQIQKKVLELETEGLGEETSLPWQ